MESEINSLTYAASPSDAEREIRSPVIGWTAPFNGADVHWHCGHVWLVGRSHISLIPSSPLNPLPPQINDTSHWRFSASISALHPSDPYFPLERLKYNWNNFRAGKPGVIALCTPQRHGSTPGEHPKCWLEQECGMEKWPSAYKSSNMIVLWTRTWCRSRLSHLCF